MSHSAAPGIVGERVTTLSIFILMPIKNLHGILHQRAYMEQFWELCGQERIFDRFGFVCNFAQMLQARRKFQFVEQFFATSDILQLEL